MDGARTERRPDGSEAVTRLGADPPLSWLPPVPSEPPPNRKYAPPPAWLVDERNRLAFVTALGLVGGVSVAWWATEHMFVHGLEDKERRTMIGVGAAALAVYGAFELLGLDKRWLDVQGAVEAASERWPEVAAHVAGGGTKQDRGRGSP